MKNSISIPSIADLPAAAKKFLQAVGDKKVIAFYAPMGAGKTTFISALCRELGVSDDAVGSPTFSIVNEYRDAAGEAIYHFDFYRITKNEEALDIGFYDYIDSGCLCLLEWPENIEEILPDDCLKLSIKVKNDGERVIEW